VTRTRDLQFVRIGCIPPERSACIRRSGCGCSRRSVYGDLRWATDGLDFSEERSGGSPRKAGRVSTWVDVIADYVCGHESSGRRDRSPFSPGPEPGETSPEPKLGCGLLFNPRAAGAARGLLWGSCGGTLISVRCRRPEAFTCKR
jgi:hypothetical protein